MCWRGVKMTRDAEGASRAQWELVQMIAELHIVHIYGEPQGLVQEDYGNHTLHIPSSQIPRLNGRSIPEISVSMFTHKRCHTRPRQTNQTLEAFPRGYPRDVDHRVGHLPLAEFAFKILLVTEHRPLLITLLLNLGLQSVPLISDPAAESLAQLERLAHDQIHV